MLCSRFLINLSCFQLAQVHFTLTDDILLGLIITALGCRALAVELL